MTRTITLTYLAGTSIPWPEWAESRGLARFDGTPGRQSYYDGSGGVRLEVSGDEHGDEPWVTFGTNHLGTGDAAVVRLALEAWATFGGTMVASPELRYLISRQSELGERLA